MYLINKEMTFDCAHLLDQHPGLCSNLHGHTYKIQVALKGPKLDKMEMLGDFGKVKNALKQVTDPFDHAVILNIHTTDPFEVALNELVKQHDKKHIEFSGLATAEAMAEYFAYSLAMLLENAEEGTKVQYVRLWETPTSFAEFQMEDYNE